MGSSKEAARVLNVYRQILKAVDKHIGKDGGKSHFREYVIDEFRKNKSLSDEAAARDKLKLACDYAFLLNSVHHHKNHRSVCKGLRPFALSRSCSNSCRSLLTTCHSIKELLFSYNIAVDRSDEVKKILDKSAASVGLRLPDVYQP